MFKKILCLGATTIALAFLFVGEVQATWENTLNFAVSENVRLLIEDPQGRRSGLEAPGTGSFLDEIPDASLQFDGDGGGIRISNLDDSAFGLYTVSYFGEGQRDFEIEIAYLDDEQMGYHDFDGFIPESVQTFTMFVDPTATPIITLNLPVEAPTDLQADPYLSGVTEKTRLTWTAAENTDVVNYNIYSVAEREPYFAKVATVDAGTTFYETADEWDSDDSTTMMVYAVTAVKADGAESFFSEVILNNDRDHDGIDDEDEAELGTDPNNPDSDGDGLIDGDDRWHSNPLVQDTDDDGFNDGDEVEAGTDALDPYSYPIKYEDGIIVKAELLKYSPFSDVSIDTLAGKAANELYRRNAISGFMNGEFKGAQSVNRAEAAKILLLARNLEVGELKNNGKFDDVVEGEWYTPFVMQAAEKEIINGYSDGNFRPANTVNTAEFLKMLSKTFDLPNNLKYTFADVAENDWFAQFSGVVSKYDLFPNRGDRFLEPARELTRDEVVTAIYQFLSNR